jgi:hypothetical protein
MGSGEKEVNCRIVSGRTLGRPATGIVEALHCPLVDEDKCRLVDEDTLDALRVNLHTPTALDPAGG